MLKSVMAHPNRSPSSWNYWGFYLIEQLQLTVGLGTIIFLTKIQSFIYNPFIYNRIKSVNFVDSTDGTQYFCKLLAICNQTKYNEEKRGGDIYGKNSKCICTC